MTRLDPQKFRLLAGGTLTERAQALALLVDHKLAVVKTGPDGEQIVTYRDPEHPCVRIYTETRSRQGSRW